LLIFLLQMDGSQQPPPGDTNPDVDGSLQAVLQATRELRAQLQATTLAQTADLGSVARAGVDVMNCVRNAALASDTERLDEAAHKFNEHLEHVLEVRFKLLFFSL
jgi:hypothetical protein